MGVSVFLPLASDAGSAKNFFFGIFPKSYI